MRYYNLDRIEVKVYAASRDAAVETMPVSALRTEILSFSPEVYWPLDELSGTVAHDISGNGRNGTYQNAPFFGVPGVPGDDGAVAVSFNFQPGGPPFRGMTFHALPDHTQVTMLGFFQNSVSPITVSEVPFSWSGAAADGYLLQFSSSTFRLGALVGEAGGYVTITDPEDESAFINKWNMFAIVEDGVANTFQLYVNGNLRAAATGIAFHGTPPSSDLALGFFNFGAGPQQAYTGYMGHVAVIPSALSQAAVNAIYGHASVAPITPVDLATPTLQNTITAPYTLGTSTAGLSGSGTLAGAGMVGALVTITTIPASWGHDWGTPIHWIPAVGRVNFATLDGWDAGQLLHTSPETVFAQSRSTTHLYYSFRPGIVATIQPLIGG